MKCLEFSVICCVIFLRRFQALLACHGMPRHFMKSQISPNAYGKYIHCCILVNVFNHLEADLSRSDLRLIFCINWLDAVRMWGGIAKTGGLFNLLLHQRTAAQVQASWRSPATWPTCPPPDPPPLPVSTGRSLGGVQSCLTSGVLLGTLSGISPGVNLVNAALLASEAGVAVQPPTWCDTDSNSGTVTAQITTAGGDPVSSVTGEHHRIVRGDCAQ